MISPDHRDVVEEIDAVAADALAAFKQRNWERAMSVFSRDLEYTQRNGTTIGWKRLAKQVRQQLRAMDSVETTSAREFMNISGDTALEISTLAAVYKIRLFWKFTKTWNLYRRSQRVWKRTIEGWKVTKVIVVEESVV